MDRYPYPHSATFTAAIFAILFCIVGVIGNLLTIIALLNYRKLRHNATTKFIINLSISDLIFSAVNLPLIAFRYFNDTWIPNETFCQTLPIIFYTNISVSLLCIVAITVNRYLLISKPEIYENLFTDRGINFMLVLIWVISFSLMLPPVTGIWGTLGLNHETFSCTILPKNGTSPKKLLFLLGFFLPSVVIIVSYFCIYWKMRESRKNIEAYIAERRNILSRRREDRRVTLLMLIIFLSFLLCYSVSGLESIINNENNMPTLQLVGSILSWAASVINPFIYAGTNKVYREAYKHILCRRSSETDSRQRSTYSSKISLPQTI